MSEMEGEYVTILGDSTFRPVTSLEYVYEVLQCGRSPDGCEDLLWLRFPECLMQLHVLWSAEMTVLQPRLQVSAFYT